MLQLRDGSGKIHAGRFSIRDSWLLPKDFERTVRVFEGMIIIEAKPNIMADRIDYLAIGPMFSEVEEGCEPLVYGVMIDNQGLVHFDTSYARRRDA